jgi:hypothetical protein
MTRVGKSAWTIGLFSIVFGFLGCGRGDLPALGDVEGTITLDGQPLENVMVQFHAEKGGRPGSGVTDKNGKYKLAYTADATGTKVGPNRVEISTVWPDGEPGPGEKDKIPPKYNGKSELKADVKAGKNTFDFNLDSK